MLNNGSLADRIELLGYEKKFHATGEYYLTLTKGNEVHHFKEHQELKAWVAEKEANAQ